MVPHLEQQTVPCRRVMNQINEREIRSANLGNAKSCDHEERQNGDITDEKLK